MKKKKRAVDLTLEDEAYPVLVKKFTEEIRNLQVQLDKAKTDLATHLNKQDMANDGR